MRIIKIGRTSTNDIVLNDATVSSSHAIIEMQEDGKVFIKDLNSINGTCVNEKKISSRVQIFANDTVKAGNCRVDWLGYINAPPKRPVAPPIYDNNQLVKKITIGRSSTNDVVFHQNDVSSSHAYIAINKDGSVLIVDSGSSNGTYVNGERVSIKALNRGDKVLLAKKHTLNWEALLPRRKDNTKILKYSSIVMATIACVIIGIFLFAKPRPWSAEKIYSTYNKTEVLIVGSYYYTAQAGQIELGNWVIKNNQYQLIEDVSNAMIYTGTGFFISNTGEIMTNNHVANPWIYEPNESEAIKSMVKNYIQEQIKGGNLDPIKFLPVINEVQVTPRMVFIGIIPNDSHFTGMGDIIQCSVIKFSQDPKIDIAIIQTNNKSLPLGVKQIVDIDNAVVEGVVIGEKIYSIGFPENFNMGSTDIGIEANNQSGEVTQNRGDIEFGHNVAIRGGASGSPVFNEYGRLVGIMNAGFTHTQGYNMAIHAKHAVELVK